LQPDEIAWSCAVAAGEAFLEVTSGPTIWHLLLVENEVLNNYLGLLNAFCETRPRTLVIVVFGPNIAALPSTPPIKGATMLRAPGDMDAWLLMLHQALGQLG
jgi:hypothetical protein